MRYLLSRAYFALRYRFEWRRDGELIAKGPFYTLQSEDVDHQIQAVAVDRFRKRDKKSRPIENIVEMKGESDE